MKIRFKIPRSMPMSSTDTFYVNEGEKAIEEGDMYPEFDPYDYALALIHRAKEEG